MCMTDANLAALDARGSGGCAMGRCDSTGSGESKEVAAIEQFHMGVGWGLPNREKHIDLNH